MPKYTVTHGSVSKTPMGGIVELTEKQAADINAGGVCVVLLKDIEKPAPKFEAPPPVAPVATHEFRPAAEAHRKPHAGKDKSK